MKTMKGLKNAHTGRRAVVVLGGPSLVANNVNLKQLRRPGDVWFLDAKALTPAFLAQEVDPEYLLLLFPERAKGNALHYWVLRAFLARMNLRPFLKQEHRPVWDEMKTNFDRYFHERKKYGSLYKRLWWNPDAYVPGSPFDLLSKLPNTKIIGRRDKLDREFPNLNVPNPVHTYSQEDAPLGDVFDLKAYYEPQETKDGVLLRNNSFLNSAAIALYPLLRYMGFREVAFLGMDMSMLGTMEYAAPFTFVSMLHFRLFFWRTSQYFNADYKVNKPWYLRPPSEFEDARQVLNYDGMRFVRVQDPYKYAAPIDWLPTISTKQFMENGAAKSGG